MLHRNCALHILPAVWYIVSTTWAAVLTGIQVIFQQKSSILKHLRRQNTQLETFLNKLVDARRCSYHFEKIQLHAIHQDKAKLRAQQGRTDRQMTFCFL